MLSLSKPLVTFGLACILVICANCFGQSSDKSTPSESARRGIPTQVDFESSASSLLCGRHRIVFRSDGRAVFLAERCRNATPRDRTTFCEVKDGRLESGSFEMLASLFEKNGFYSLQSEYSRSVSDSEFDSFRVVRDGKTNEVVEYAGGGPFELWVIQQVIEGIASAVEWDKTKSVPKCPRWKEPKVPLPQ
jgi:hypothetical protein